MPNDQLLGTETPALEFDFNATTRAVGRLLCLFVGLAIVGLGVYCGWRVFEHVQSVINDGKPLESAVDAVAKVIRADEIKVEDPKTGAKVELGRTAAVGLVWLFCLPAMWIGLGFIKAGAGLITAAISETGRR